MAIEFILSSSKGGFDEKEVVKNCMQHRDWLRGSFDGIKPGPWAWDWAGAKI